MKSSFFGIHADARRVVYVVDASTSMNRPYDGEAKTRFGQMKIELAKSILSLKPEQQFFIIFFNEHPIPMPANGMANAIGENQQQYLTWMASVPANGTDRPAAVDFAGAEPQSRCCLFADRRSVPTRCAKRPLETEAAIGADQHDRFRGHQGGEIAQTAGHEKPWTVCLRAVRDGIGIFPQMRISCPDLSYDANALIPTLTPA